MRIPRCVLRALVACFLLPSIALPSVLLVDASAPGPTHDGSTWAKAYLTIQAAIDVASAGDDVLVAEGTYWPTNAYHPSGGSGPDVTILMANQVNVRGGYLGYNGGVGSNSTNPLAPDGSYNNTVLTAVNTGLGTTSHHVVVADSSITQETDLDGFKIQDGEADGSGSNRDKGAGILVDAAHLLVEHVRLKDNVADADGGAIWFNRDGSSGSLRVNGIRPQFGAVERGWR